MAVLNLFADRLDARLGCFRLAHPPVPIQLLPPLIRVKHVSTRYNEDRHDQQEIVIK